MVLVFRRAVLDRPFVLQLSNNRPGRPNVFVFGFSDRYKWVQNELLLLKLSLVTESN